MYSAGPGAYSYAGSAGAESYTGSVEVVVADHGGGSPVEVNPVRNF